MTVRVIPSLSILVLLFLPSSGEAQSVFMPDLDDGTGWTIVQDPDAAATFGFDYSPFGIPPAPHGLGTTGLRLAANLEDPGEVAVISASPDDISVSGQYTVEVDFWINYNVDPALVGTTEFIGAFVGFDQTAGEPLNGAGFLGDSDGDTARDYRLYKDGEEQFIESGQYEIVSQNNTDIDLQIQFPGAEAPLEQSDPAWFDPPNEPTLAADGTLAFGWHTLVIDVDSNVGTAAVSIDDFAIGVVDATIGAPVSLTGGIALTFGDLFASVSTNPEFSFGVFDHLVVTQMSETPLQAGDADMDLDFDQLDLVKVQIAARYLTGLAATWGEGDWDGAPGGAPGTPPAGNGFFDQLDIIAALSPGHYLTGPYAASVAGGGFPGNVDGNPVPVPEPSTFLLAVVATFSLTGFRGRPRSPDGTRRGSKR